MHAIIVNIVCVCVCVCQHTNKTSEAIAGKIKLQVLHTHKIKYKSLVTFDILYVTNHYV